MIVDICYACMRVHELPQCDWDADAPCPRCKLPMGYAIPEMDGSACWFCLTGRPRVRASGIIENGRAK